MRRRRRSWRVRTWCSLSGCVGCCGCCGGSDARKFALGFGSTQLGSLGVQAVDGLVLLVGEKVDGIHDGEVDLETFPRQLGRGVLLLVLLLGLESFFLGVADDALHLDVPVEVEHPLGIAESGSHLLDRGEGHLLLEAAQSHRVDLVLGGHVTRDGTHPRRDVVEFPIRLHLIFSLLMFRKLDSLA